MRCRGGLIHSDHRGSILDDHVHFLAMPLDSQERLYPTPKASNAKAVTTWLKKEYA